jgi:hypothetical protein
MKLKKKKLNDLKQKKKKEPELTPKIFKSKRVAIFSSF